jgi:hypothetical protein
MNWIYDSKIIETAPENYIGFVYLITNLVNNKKYIGKKLFCFSKIKYKTHIQKNGKKVKKKIKTLIDSDWQEYWGSSENLHKDIQLLGKDNFTREILYFCKSKAELSYTEAREQFNRQVLESDEYYNGIINVRVGTSLSLKQALLEQKHQNNKK